MGGRGAGSAGGAGGASGRTQSEHMGIWYPPPPLGDRMAEYTGATPEEGDKMVRATEKYSGSYYGEMREAAYKGDKNSPYYEDAMAVERMIERAPKWAGGEIYRGMNVDANTLASFQEGAEIDMRGMSSWSSKAATADMFAHHGGSGGNPVVFRASGTKKGTSITHVSVYGEGEGEVLVSGKAKWRVKKVTQGSDGVTYVDVDELP